MSPDAQPTDGWVLADAFDRAAPTYDAMVALSPGYHDQLAHRRRGPRRPAAPTRARHRLARRARPRLRLGRLDARGPRRVGGAGRAQRRASPCRGSTPPRAWSPRPARSRWPRSVELVVSDAVAHLESLDDGSVDGVLAAYLLRNVPDRERLVREVARVLRPGGALVIHDYSVAGSVRARATWAAVCHGIIIPLAVVKRSDVPLHRYLYTSVRDFDSVRRRLRPPPVASAWSTSGTARTPAGSTASCTPSSGRHRRDPAVAAHHAGVPGWTAGRSSTRRRSPRPPGGPDAVPPGARHVVVVGGGIAGLTAALGLAERGIRVTLLERDGRPRRTGALVAGRRRGRAPGR